MLIEVHRCECVYTLNRKQRKKNCELDLMAVDVEACLTFQIPFYIFHWSQRIVKPSVAND